MTQNDTFVVGATQINLGPLGASIFPQVIKPGQGCVGGELRVITIGVSSLVQIYPQALVAAGSSVGGATGVLNGYPLGASQVFQWVGPAAFYISSTGSTSVIAIAFNYSAGATLA